MSPVTYECDVDESVSGSFRAEVAASEVHALAGQDSHVWLSPESDVFSVHVAEKRGGLEVLQLPNLCLPKS